MLLYIRAPPRAMITLLNVIVCSTIQRTPAVNRGIENVTQGLCLYQDLKTLNFPSLK